MTTTQQYELASDPILNDRETLGKVLETKQRVVVRLAFAPRRGLVCMCEIDQSDVDGRCRLVRMGGVSLVDDEEGGGKETKGGLRAKPSQERL